MAGRTPIVREDPPRETPIPFRFQRVPFRSPDTTPPQFDTAAGDRTKARDSLNRCIIYRPTRNDKNMDIPIFWHAQPTAFKHCGIRTTPHHHTSPSPPPPTTLPLPQHLLEKLLKAQRHKPIPIIIIPLKRIRHPLQRNTRLHKQIKAQAPLPSLIKRPKQKTHKPLTKPIPKRHQRGAELVQADVARAIGVEAVEEGAPGGEEGPEAAELAELDGAAAGGVEHADHEGDGVGVEGGPVTVYEGGGELGLGEVAAACCLLAFFFFFLLSAISPRITRQLG